MNKKKKIIIAVFCAMCVLGALSWYLVYKNPDFLSRTKQEVEKEVIGMYGSTKSYAFYPADEEPSAEIIREYRELDRYIHYTDGAETLLVTEENSDSFAEEVRFFLKYFQLVKDGKYKEYNELFTPDYFKTNEKTCDFTPQMLYDINVVRLYEGEKDGCPTFSFNVSYKIFRNNGTFRNDIGSDGAKKLCFTLINNGEEILIDTIDYYI